ncbi:hypothetical protein [Nitrospirillum bahiense]|uniref:Chaperone modulatory protein CbpM n=1 Tax=Nitrospirillum amazonense TaxID=28077 RepID=A0A560FUV6_9PROT|nr:hypothetical protein [Nitrospirillum amazonense]TWB25382.1 chaperone modulatory protein CbpM [Nitrospirillum amazonense]
MGTLTLLTLKAVCARFPEVGEQDIHWWVTQGWVRPDGPPTPEHAADWRFHPVDVARVGLIRDLRHDMGVADDTLPLVLSLIDQVYSLRAALRGVAGVLDRLPPEVRQTVLAVTEEVDPSGP